MTATKAIASAAYLSQVLQRGPGEIHAAAERAGVRPAMSINGRLHYRESDVSKIKAALNQG
jgi:hypothetical protein